MPDENNQTKLDQVNISWHHQHPCTKEGCMCGHTISLKFTCKQCFEAQLKPSVFSHLPAFTVSVLAQGVTLSCHHSWLAVAILVFQSQDPLHILQGCLKPPERLHNFGKSFVIRTRVFLSGRLKGIEVQWGFNYHIGTWSKLH